ncbi:MAG: PQQ-binding-like beta-propeller repeat protein [bacterium]|nr:PQQ-binding-like beta-propeller repeat protein [bacterium]
MMIHSSTRLLPLLGALLAVVGSVAGEERESTPEAGEVLAEHVTGGQVWSSPVHHEGVVFIGSDDGALWALDVRSLEPRWKIHTGGRVRSTVAVAARASGATVVADTVLFSSDDGHLRAVALSGEERWRFDLGGRSVARILPHTRPPHAYDYLSSSPVVHDGVVYIGSAGGHLYAVDVASGRQRWRFRTEAPIRSTPVVNGGSVFFTGWDHHVYAVTAEEGKEIWRFDTGGIVQASPVLGDGRLYVGSRNPKVFALDRRDGSKIWEYVHEDGSWAESTGVYDDGTVYMGSSDALKLLAFDAATGKVRWSYRTGGWSWATPVVADNAVYIGAISAHPYYFEGITLERGLHAVDRRTGTRLWSVATRALPGFVTGGVFSRPLVLDDRVIFGALDHRVYAVRR